MRHALIIAGGSGTRLWPMSRSALPKQLIPLINGRSLLELSVARLQQVVPAERLHICAAEQYRQLILEALPQIKPAQYIAEPMGRDTLNAVALGTMQIAQSDPQAMVGVFTADHIIEPIDTFARIVNQGYEIAEAQPRYLITFGVAPTFASTGYGYLELGAALHGHGHNLTSASPHVVRRFKEKPDLATAKTYLSAGAGAYLWNSGMFVWKADTFMDCVKRYHPDNHRLIADALRYTGSPQAASKLAEAYGQLKKISVDYAVMEPAAQDSTGQVGVAAIPMSLRWLDVGSWPTYAQTCATDEQSNTTSHPRQQLVDCKRVMAASSDAGHLITAIGCEDLIIVHTPQATLVCRADRAEDIKKLHQLVGEKFGKQWL